MSMRHAPRPQERLRLHDPQASEPHPPFSQQPIHLNGSAPPPSDLQNPAMLPPAANSPATAPNGVASGTSVIHKLAMANEQTWLLIGQVAEQMGDLEHAQLAFENVLRHNPVSLSGLTQVAAIARIRENYPKAIEFFQRALTLQEDNGEVWSALGHCYLMQDDLQKAYSAYQQALYLLPNPKEDPKLWYGIGILYDRYGSLDHAEEAFASVLRMARDDLDPDKENEILFRLGIIYKQQMKYADSLRCFDRILRNPPSPLAHADIWFQIGHVHEQQKELVRAKDAYEKVVAENPTHAKVLQQLGWLYHQDESSFQNQDVAIQYLTKSLEADPSDAQSWYLLGRAYMAGQKYNKAYEAYQQAVYRDGRNPTFWCSIGVLYFQISQYRDALDAYSRAIRINPYISEVWFDLGSLYESCNNQISDAIDAYARASELDRGNTDIAERLQLLKNAQATGAALPAAPGPQDVHPTAYANAVIAPPGLSGPPAMLQSANSRQLFGPDARGPGQDGHHSRRTPPGPFRGGPPPPVILDDSRHMTSHTPLAPMDVDRISHHDHPAPSRDGPGRGPANSHNILLHHPVPQQLPDEVRATSSHRNSISHQESYFTRPQRPPSVAASPTMRMRGSPPPPFQAYPSNRQPIPPMQGGPTQPPQRSPRYSSRDPSRRGEPEGSWDPRSDYERRPRHSGDYPPSSSAPSFPPRSPSLDRRMRSPPVEVSQPYHRDSRSHWDSKASSGPSPSLSRPYHHSPPESSGHRYDPIQRYDQPRDDMNVDTKAPPPPIETPRSARTQQPPVNYSAQQSDSRASTPSAPDSVNQRKRASKEKDDIVMAEPQKRERKKRAPSKRKQDDMATNGSDTPKSGYEPGPSNKPGPGYKGSPEPLSSGGSALSAKPSPTSGTPHPPTRVVDEDYDEGVADALMGLASYRAPENVNHESNGQGLPPLMQPVNRHPDNYTSRPTPSHRSSLPSARDRPSPPQSLKRPLSPGPDEEDSIKRSRVDTRRRSSPRAVERVTPVPSTRPSPIPFRTQPTSHSPEARQNREAHPPATSPRLPALPPHPRPIGAGLSTHGTSSSINLPPIATLSPASTTASPAPPSGDRDHEDRRQPPISRSTSPHGKFAGRPGSPKHSPAPSSASGYAEKRENA